MSQPVGILLSLGGSLCAALALTSGEAPHRAAPRWWQRLTPRMVLALVLLALALAVGVTDAFAAPGGEPVLTWAALTALALGTGAALWAFVSGPSRVSSEPPAERLSRRGKIALGLLSAAELAAFGAGQAAALPDVNVSLPTALGVLGLVLVGVAGGSAAATFRAPAPLRPGPEPWWQRVSPLARVTLVVLGLAAAVLALSAALFPGPGATLSLVLLLLGAAAGILSYTFDPRAPAPVSAAPSGISPHRWVALALVGLAGLAFGAERFGLSTAPSRTEAAASTAAAPALPAAKATEPPGGAVRDHTQPTTTWTPGAAATRDPDDEDDLSPSNGRYKRLGRRE